MSTRPAQIHITDPAGGHPPRLDVDGIEIDVPPDTDPVEVGIGVVAQEAQRRGHPVRAVLLDDRDAMQWRVVIGADGAATDDIEEVQTRPRRRTGRRRVLLAAVLAAAVLTGGVTYGHRRDAATGTRPPAAPAALPARPVDGPSTSATPPAVTTPPGRPSPAPAPAPPPVLAAPPPPARSTAPRPTPPVRSKDNGAPRTEGRRATPAPPPPSSRTTPTSAAPVGGRLIDGLGHCLTGSPDGGAVWTATCDGGSSQSWTYVAGTLRNTGRCLAPALNGLAIGACTIAEAAGWSLAGAGRVVYAGHCLERLQTGDPAITQCGIGKPLVLTT